MAQNPVSGKTATHEKDRVLILGDDAISTANADWFDFGLAARALADQLYTISKSSGVCCGILGCVGSGKSSFMKLIEEHATKTHSVHVTWFTAWDPGGLHDIGDAMLYRLFSDVAEKEASLSDALKRLKEALGLRKSLRHRVGEALGAVSEATGVAQPLLDASSKLLLELDTPKRIQDSFQELVKWLDEKDQTVFLFVDDIDRASGEQILDLLSALKVYVSHRRIVGVIGYDEEYVLNALGPKVPPGIDEEISGKNRYN